MQIQEKITITTRLSEAITIAKAGLENKGSLNMKIAANGPTIGQVIDKALSLVPETKVIDAEIALLKNELIVLKDKLKENSK